MTAQIDCELFLWFLRCPEVCRTKSNNVVLVNYKAENISLWGKKNETLECNILSEKQLLMVDAVLIITDAGFDNKWCFCTHSTQMLFCFDL